MPRPLKILYEYFALYSSLTLLGVICLAWSVFALPLFFFCRARLGTAIGRRGIMSGFGSMRGRCPSPAPIASICAPSIR